MNIKNNQTNALKNTEKLPIWDLKDLYISQNDKELSRDLNKINNGALKFEKKYLNKVSESLDCQVSNVITAIEADAMLSVRDILQDTKIVDHTIWDKISTGSEKVATGSESDPCRHLLITSGLLPESG